MKPITKKTALASSIAAAVLLTSGQAQAFDFSAGEVDFQWNNHVTYGAMYRVKDPGKANTQPQDIGAPSTFVPADTSGNGIPDTWIPTTANIPGVPAYNPGYTFVDAAQAARVKNGNDGNLNFDKGLVQNRISVLSELAINYENFGAFIRARAWYDNVYKNGEPAEWDGAALGYNRPDASKNDEFLDGTVDYLGSEAEILDAYLYGNFRLGSRLGSLKVGKQVINWGESLAFANSINSAINPVDANAGTRAGVDLKEIFLPTEALYFQLALTQKITMQTFYQWKHQGTILLSSGSFFSETDMLGAGGEYSWAGGSLAKRNNLLDEVEDGGQYGLAFTYFSDNGTEYGIYAVNTHDKAPSLQTNRSGQGTYDTWYAEDRKVFAASFSTVWGETNISGEYSYRPNAPVVLSPGCVNLAGLYAGASQAIGSPYPGSDTLLSCTKHEPAEVADASYSQAQVSFTNVRPGSMFYDQLTTAGEIVAWKYHSIDKTGVYAKESDMFVTNTPQGFGTLLRVGFDYFNAFAGANLSIPFTWQYGWQGTNQRSNTREGASIFSVGAQLTFPNNIVTSLTYTQYDGEDDQLDPTFYSLSDRDNIAFSAKYSF